MKPVELFSRDVHTFWATTYQFDLKLFDQFLLRRLGNQPLNAVILADEENVTQALAGLTEVDLHVAFNANRRYMLRGARTPSGGRFHPKTYFLSSRRRTVLLIGSGNLTRPGLDRGREAFCAYDAANEADVGVIRAWAGWIGELIGDRNDEHLLGRYNRLRTVISGLSGQHGSDEFRTNGDEPLIDALAATAPSGVNELHVTAPYYDERAEALGQLIERLPPARSLNIYLGAHTNVDGASLRRALETASCEVVVRHFTPEQFVHAKLIGVTAEDDSGVLLCGSPNLSRAALISTYADPGSYGNCEVAVLRRGSAADVRAAFQPPETTLELADLDAVEALEYEADETPAHAYSVRLLTAELTPDDHLRVRADAASVDGLALAWEGGTPLALTPDGRTKDPLGEDDGPLIVWLVDEAGQVCSNRVVVDDPKALEEMLGERGGATDRPVEIADEDERADLVALLSWAHQHFIFDLDDTPAVRRANNAEEQQREQDDTGFWERYVREELMYDTRSQTYRPLSGARTLGSVDLLLREIEAMLKAAPHERRLRVVRDDTATDDGEQTGHAWSFSARQRLRARNLIRRWARALADPRHVWVATDAPAVNYTALIDLLTLIWLGDGLGDDDVMVELLEEVWSGLLGAPGRKGLFDVADDELCSAFLEDVSDDTRHLATGLAYVALHNDMPWTHYVYEWQPFLKRGIELGVFAAGDLSSDLAAALLDDESPSQTGIEDLLLRRADWVDDETWGKRMAADLGLGRVAIRRRAGYKNVDLVVHVDGLPDAARDSRTVVIARRAIRLKRSDHVLIEAGSERILLRLGENARARVDGQTRRSVATITSERLRAVEAQGGSLAELLGLAA